MERQSSAYELNPAAASRSVVSDYLELIKVRLTSMIVLTAVGAFLIVSGWESGWMQILILGLGGFCVTGASNALNQALEKDYDRLMERTKDRPVASGRMTMAQAVLFAGFMCLAGITLLATFNPLTAFFGMMALVLYAFVYTPLKRYSSAAITVGAVAGAMPMLIGSVAWYGHITWLAIILFAIQFAWQYPHFWAIGYLGHKDYSKAGYRFIPTGQDGLPSLRIAWSSVFFSVVLVALGMGLYTGGFLSLTATLILSVLSAFFVYQSIVFLKSFNMQSGKRLMLASLFYIPVLLLILLIDKLG